MVVFFHLEHKSNRKQEEKKKKPHGV